MSSSERTGPASSALTGFTPIPPAVAAVAVDLQGVPGEGEAVAPGHLGQRRLHGALGELHRAATVDADQVMVVVAGRRQREAVGVARVQVRLAGDAELGQ